MILRKCFCAWNYHNVLESRADGGITCEKENTDTKLKKNLQVKIIQFYHVS